MRGFLPGAGFLALLVLIWSTGACAVTLEQYFYAFSDRDRGVYITGVLDLFAADSSRDPEYRHCVQELGAAGMHDAVSGIVKDDPRLLSFDAALWILYEASRRCNTAAGEPPIPDPRSMLRPATGDGEAAADDVPDLESATGPARIEAPDAPEGTLAYLRDWRYAGVGAILLALLAALSFAAVRWRRTHSARRSSARHSSSGGRNG